MEAQIIQMLNELMKRQPDELLTVNEVAKILKVNVSKVYELIKSGELRGLKLGAMKVRRSTLNKFMAKLEEVG